MKCLFGAQLYHQLIRFFEQIMQNPGTLFQDIWIQCVFRAKLLGARIEKKTSALTEMGHNELVAKLLIVSHCAKTGTCSRVHFFQLRDCCDIQQL